MSNSIISRRKLLASLGVAGAAFAVERLATGSGGMQAIAGSVAQSVYGNEEAEGCRPSGCAALDVKSFGAVGDGVTDDTTAIQLALDSLEERQTLCFPAGTYLLSGVTITTKHIRLEGEHAILRLTDQTKNVFNLVAADGLRLHGFTADTSYTGQTVAKYNGLFTYGYGDNVRISNIQASGMGMMLNYSKRPIVQNCTFDSSANLVEYGIILNACEEFVVTGNKVGGLTIDGIKTSSLNAFRSPTGSLETESYGVISHNFIHDCPNDDGIDIYDGGRKIVVAFNTIVRCDKGINIKSQGLAQPATDYWAEYSLIIGNQVHECNQFMQVGGSHYDICHNICTNENPNYSTARRGVTIGVDQIYPIVRNVRFTNNTIVGASNHGVELGAYARDIQLGFNHIAQCGAYAYQIRADGVSIVGGVLKDARGDRYINVNISGGVGDVSISNIRMVNEQVTNALYGIRVTNNVSHVSVAQCQTSGITTPFRDDTAGKRVVHYGNVWNGKPSGATAARPAVPATGQWYYDTDLSMPICFDGANWTDSSGTIV